MKVVVSQDVVDEAVRFEPREDVEVSAQLVRPSDQRMVVVGLEVRQRTPVRRVTVAGSVDV